MNLREFTSALIMEDCLRSWPEAAICFTAWKERSHMHKEVALRRFAALPYLWKNRAWVTVAAPTGKGLLGDLCQMLLLKEQPHWEDKERSSSLYAFTMCVCVCSLMSGGTQCPAGVQHQTRVAYWEILHPVIHTYMLAFYTLHSPRGHSVPAYSFYSGRFQVSEILKG